MLLGYTRFAEATLVVKPRQPRRLRVLSPVPQYVSPQISPSGHYLAGRVTIKGKLGLLVNPISSDGTLLLDSDRWTIRKTLWVSDHELLVSYSRQERLAGFAS